MAASDATFVPKRNAAYRVYLPILDADGDLVTGATGLDSEVSKDGGTFADCTNEATEIATSSGMYFLDLTATEMDADAVCVIVKTSSAGAKTTPIVLYTATRDIDDLAYPTTTGRSIDVDASGGVEVGSFQAGAITAAAIATDAIDADAMADGAITAGTFAADAITAAKVAADVSAEIADAVWDEARSGHVAAGSFGEGVASVQGNVTGSVGSVTGAVGSVTGAVGSVASGGITAASIATGAVDADALAADAVAEIADGVWDEAASGHTAAGTFGQYLQVVRNGTAQAGAATTVTLDASASATDDLYNGQYLFLVGGTGAGQSRVIVDYVGSTKVATVDRAWATNPDSTSVFVIFPSSNAKQDTSGQVTVGGFATDAVNAAALAADAVTEIQSGLATAAALNTVDDFLDTEVAAIKAKTDNLPAAPAATGDIPTAATIADAVWDEATTGHVTAGTFGEQLKTDVDAILADTGTDGVIVATNNDKTGYRLSATGVDDILDEAITEPAGMFAWASATLRNIIGVVGALARNEINSDSNSVDVRNDADTATLWAYAASDDGTTFTSGEGA